MINGNVLNTVSSKETSNQSNCVVSTLSNDDLTRGHFRRPCINLTHSLTRSLARSVHLSLPQLNSIKLNELMNQPINQSDYSHIHSRINFHLLIHTLSHSLIHSHNFTHSLDHLIVHAFNTHPVIPSLKSLFAHSIIYTFA